MDELVIVWSIVFLVIVLIFHQLSFPAVTKDPRLQHLQREIAKVNPAILDVAIVPGNATYTLNKRVIYVKMDDDAGRPLDWNSLVYRALHELAHVIDRNHDDTHEGTEWNSIFNSLILRAQRLGIYDSSYPVTL